MVTKFNKIKRDDDSQLVIFSVLLGVLFAFVVGFFIVSSYRLNARRSELNVKIDSLKREISALERQKQQLDTQISQSSQESFVEKEARERLNLQKPGENVVAILPPQNNGESRQKGDSLLENLYSATIGRVVNLFPH